MSSSIIPDTRIMRIYPNSPLWPNIDYQLGSRDPDLFSCHCHGFLLMDTCSALGNEVEWELVDTVMSVQVQY